MSPDAYRAVAWTPAKKRYDVVLGASMLAYVVVHAGASLARHPNLPAETLIMRTSGSLAFVMMTAALLAGPLSRLSPRFLPVLRNRRHLGVATFLAALVHGGVAFFQFHFLGVLNPAASLLLDGGALGAGSDGIPFQILGAFALLVLFLMAATSHDFWLASLTPRAWKALHMLAYPAYAALLGHVALGALQQEARDYAWVMVAAVAAAVFAAHAASAWTGRTGDRARAGPDGQGFVRAARTADLRQGRGRVVDLGASRVAVFLHESSIVCVSNVCSHQMGPLGEGKIVDGYVTCPWHGFQFDPATGRAPAPFDDCIETHDTAVRDGWVWIRTCPNAAGAVARSARIETGVDHREAPSPRHTSGSTALGPRIETGIDRQKARGRSARPLAATALVAAVAVGVAGGLGHRALEGGFFEFGVVRSATGMLVADPYPALLVPRGPVWSRYLLAGQGKHGADDLVADHVGSWATISGSLVYRDGHAMVEVRTVAPVAAPPASPQAVAEDLGRHVAEGEIVGAKCYMGVMNPSHGVVHRACAALCIRGGIPPLLRVEHADGTSQGLVLADADGRPLNGRLGGRAGTLVRVVGRLVRVDATLYLYADPADITQIG